jgi:hypothetical protein
MAFDANGNTITKTDSTQLPYQLPVKIIEITGNSIVWRVLSADFCQKIEGIRTSRSVAESLALSHYTQKRTSAVRVSAAYPTPGL